MISILIPVFNTSVQELVMALHHQMHDLSLPGEIIVYDDFSNENFKATNRAITFLQNVVYKELDTNMGRSRIRNLLATNAQYEWLLFLDSDSLIIDNNYLKKYLEIISSEYEVYTGGRKYELEIPDNCNKRLHWKYGTLREAPKGRRTVLHVNNFCIRKKLFLDMSFPQELQGYGHEDTWMQMELSRRAKQIAFFDNPILHNGLEDSRLFLEKTKNALKNLSILSQIFTEEELKKQVGLYKIFYWQKKLGMVGIVNTILKTRIKQIEQKLLSCNPSLFLFDLYRLYHLSNSNHSFIAH
jgi:glycosyltransferase involved in cell wall biosynthesis